MKCPFRPDEEYVGPAKLSALEPRQHNPSSHLGSAIGHLPGSCVLRTTHPLGSSMTVAEALDKPRHQYLELDPDAHRWKGEGWETCECGGWGEVRHNGYCIFTFDSEHEGPPIYHPMRQRFP